MIESVGMNYGLAVFAVIVTRNTHAIDGRDQAPRCTTLAQSGCDIFTCDGAMAIRLTSVTVFAYLLTGNLKARIIKNRACPFPSLLEVVYDQPLRALSGCTGPSYVGLSRCVIEV